MGSKYSFSLNSIKPERNYKIGKLTYVTSDEVPGFANIAFASLVLNNGGALEPIWHPNAHKIGYCTQGSALVSIRSPENVDIFTVNAGEMFFIPKGYIHHIANFASQECLIKFAFSNSKPQEMCLSKAIFSLSESVFDTTFNTSSSFLDGLKKSQKEELIKVLPPSLEMPKPNSVRYKFNIGESKKIIQNKGGYLQVGTKVNLPTLEGLGILGFGLNPKGIVEPHWHTNAGELVYIAKGEARMTILSPEGKVEVLKLKKGEGAFAPTSYFHSIENTGNEDVEVIAFFSDAQPDYMGIGEVMGAYSNELLATTFNVSPDYFKTFNKTQEPLVII